MKYSKREIYKNEGKIKELEEKGIKRNDGSIYGALLEYCICWKEKVNKNENI